MSGVIQRLFWRVFPPDEVTAIRRQIKEFLRRVSPTYPLPPELERRAIAPTKDVADVLERVREERQPADRLALVMLSSTMSDMLMSGQYHIYRGVLSGEGHALVSAFNRCMSDLQQRGYQTTEETDEAVRRLRDEIKRLG